MKVKQNFILEIRYILFFVNFLRDLKYSYVPNVLKSWVWSYQNVFTDCNWSGIRIILTFILNSCHRSKYIALQGSAYNHQISEVTKLKTQLELTSDNKNLWIMYLNWFDTLTAGLHSERLADWGAYGSKI